MPCCECVNDRLALAWPSDTLPQRQKKVWGSRNLHASSPSDRFQYGLQGLNIPKAVHPNSGLVWALEDSMLLKSMRGRTTNLQGNG